MVLDELVSEMNLVSVFIYELYEYECYVYLESWTKLRLKDASAYGLTPGRRSMSALQA